MTRNPDGPMRWRLLTVAGLLYAVQFTPAIFVFMTLPIIMRQEGHTGTAIGLVQLVGIPYIFKFLWAPLIDKYRLGRQRYKSWIAGLSGLHIATLIVLSFLDPAGPIAPLMVVLVIAIASVSTQDIAVDALIISLMRPGERTMGASFQTFGMYLGAVIGGFGFLYLYGIIGWSLTLLALAATFATPLVALLFVEEPVRPRDAPPVNIRSALRFFIQPRMTRWLTLMASLRLPLVLISLPIRLIMVDQGMTTEEIALWFGLIAMCGAGGATAILGPLTHNVPRVMALYLVGFVNVVVLGGVSLLAASLPEAIRYAIVVTWVAIAITDVVLFRGAMDRVRQEIPGFDFSVQIGVLTLLPVLTNPLAGFIFDSHGSLAVFIAALAFAAIPLAILRFGFAPLRGAAVGLDGEKLVSMATFRTDDAAKVLDGCQILFSEHGISDIRREAGALVAEEMGCKVEMTAHGGAIDIRIEAPSDNFMTFIRDEIVENLEELDPAGIRELRWTGGIRVGELPSNFRILRTSRREEIFPGLIRVTLSGIDVASLTQDGIHIKLMMPEKRDRTPVWPVIGENGGISWPRGEEKLHARFVTIRDIRLDKREIDVDVAHHDGGLISDWAALPRDQQEVGVMGPGGDQGLPATKNVVLAADYTGLPALARLIAGVDGQVTGHLLAAAPSQAVLESYLPPSNLAVTAVDPASFSERAPDLIRNCTNRPVSYAWFAGEFTVAQAARSIFKEQFGLSPERQLSVAYWRKNMPGHSSRAL